VIDVSAGCKQKFKTPEMVLGPVAYRFVER
jgi:hypothetical protein